MPNSGAPAQRLRQSLNTGETLVVPGVVDGVAAAMARAAGFTTIYASGAGIAAAHGLPDMGVLSLSELVASVRIVCQASKAGAIVDLDTGYGGPVTLRRALHELEEAGAAAIHIEDQGFPRRCGFLTTEPCVSIGEMQSRLDAARMSGTELVVVARTDALLTEGLESAIARAQAYVQGGADLIFVNGIESLEQLRTVRSEVEGPLLYNVSGSDRSPRLSRREAAEIGVSVIIYPIQIARAAARAAKQYLDALAADVAADVPLLGFEEYMGLAGWDDARAFEAKIPDVEKAAANRAEGPA